VAVAGRDPAGREFHSAGGVWVSGTDFVPWRVSNDTRLDLSLDRDEYRPGDVAHVLVQAGREEDEVVGPLRHLLPQPDQPSVVSS